MSKEATKQEVKETKVKNKKLQIFLNILILIFLCAFLYSSFKLIIWIRNHVETKKLENQMQSEILVEKTVENEETDEQEPQNELEVDFAKLEEMNRDVIGWIKIEDTYINYPILYSDTYGYYVERDINKKYNASGSIFVDPGTNKEFKDPNTVLWGHHMKNGRMFANLNKIYKGELGENVEVKIITKQETIIYKVFASYVMDLDNATIKQNLTDKEKQTYIDRAIKRSKITFNTENMDKTKQILTLVTCTADGEQRIVVNAIKQ